MLRHLFLALGLLLGASLFAQFPATLGDIQPGWWSAMWELEPVAGNNIVRIKNRYRGTYLHHESGKLEMGSIQPGWWSAMWVLEPVGSTKFVHIKNRYRGTYLHHENGKLELGGIQPAWWSAMWTAEKLNGEKFVRLKNRWKGVFLHTEYRAANAISRPAPRPTLTFGGNNQLATGQIDAFLRGVEQQKIDLQAGTRIPGGMNNRERPNPGHYWEDNFGNHIQGLAIFPDGKRFATTYSQHYTKGCKVPVGSDLAKLLPKELPNWIVPDFLSGINFQAEATRRLEADCNQAAKTYYDNKKSLIPIAGKGMFKINRVPSYNFIEPSGVSVVGNLMAVGWAHTIKVYIVNSMNGQMTEIPELALKDRSNNPGYSQVALTDHQGRYFLATAGSSKDDKIPVAFYQLDDSDGKLSWVQLSTFDAQVSSNPPGNVTRGNGEWVVDAINMVSDGKDIYLVNLQYWKMSATEYSRERVSFTKIFVSKTTPRYVRTEDKGYVNIPRSARTWDKAFFRWGGTAFVNPSGKLEIYNCDRVYAEADKGWLGTFRYTAK